MGKTKPSTPGPSRRGKVASPRRDALRVLEILGRDRTSVTSRLEGPRGRILIGREFSRDVAPGFCAHLRHVYGVQRETRVAGLVRPVGLIEREESVLWLYAPVAGVPLSRHTFAAPEAVEYLWRVTALLASLHARSLFGVEIAAERLFVGKGTARTGAGKTGKGSAHKAQGSGKVVLAGLLASPEVWIARSGLDVLVRLEPRVDLAGLGGVFETVLERTRASLPAEVALVEAAVATGETLRAPDLDARPTLEDVLASLRLPRSPDVPARRPRPGPPPVPPLVGRDLLAREIEVLLDRALKHTSHSSRRPLLLAITGRPGLGKSRVAVELATRARREGTLVLAAEAREGDRRLLGPLEDVLAEARAGAQALPESPPPAPTSHLLSPAAERRRQIEASVQSLLGALRGRPAVLLLEDIDRLPALALEPLSYLVREVALDEPEAARLALVVTLRAGDEAEVQGPAARLVDDLREEGFAERVRLPPLDTAAQGEVLAALGLQDPELAAKVTARAGSLPRLLEQLSRLALEGGLAVASAPSTMAETFRRRVRNRSPVERRVLEAAAVIGGPTGLDLLAPLLASSDRAKLLPTVLGLVAERLLRASAGPAFELDDRDSARWLTERVPAARSRRLHRAAARALEAEGQADPERLARHDELGGLKSSFIRHGLVAAIALEQAHANEQALELYARLERAVPRRDLARRADLLGATARLRGLVGDFDGAIDAYRRLLEMPHDPATAWLLYKALGEVYRDTEQYAAAAEAFDRGLSTLGEGEDLAVADLLSEKAGTLARLGDVDTARGLVQMAGDLAAGLPESREVAAVRNRVGAIFHRLGDSDRAVSHIEAGLQMSVAVGALDLAAIALNNLGLYLGFRGELTRATELLLRSLEIHERLGDVEAIATTAVNVGALYVRLCDLDKAQRYLDQALRMALRFGKSFIVAFCHANLAEVNFLRARYGEALEGRERALRMAERLGRHPEYAHWLSGLCRDWVLLGQTAEAERGAARLLQIGRDRDDPRLVALSSQVVGNVARLKGAFDEAVVRLDEAEAVFRDLQADEQIVSCLLDRAELELARGAWREALLKTAEAQEIATARRLHVDRAQALLLAAEALLGEDLSASERALREAEGIARELDQPELRWRAEALAGELALRRGDRTGAARRFAHGREVLDRIVELLPAKDLSYGYMRDRRRLLVLRRSREQVVLPGD